MMKTFGRPLLILITSFRPCLNWPWRVSVLNPIRALLGWGGFILATILLASWPIFIFLALGVGNTAVAKLAGPRDAAETRSLLACIVWRIFQRLV